MAIIGNGSGCITQFGTRVRAIRLAKGISIAECARRADLWGGAGWRRFETERFEPCWRNVCLIADTLGVSVAAFRTDQPHVGPDFRWLRWYRNRVRGFDQGVGFVLGELSTGRTKQAKRSDRERKTKILTDADVLVYHGAGLYSLHPDYQRPPKLPIL